MAFEFPSFDEPTPIGAGRSWTATYLNYDQHYDDIYFRVTVIDGDGEITRLMAVFSPYAFGDDWTVPAFAADLRECLHKVAAAGTSNTAYTGNGWVR